MEIYFVTSNAKKFSEAESILKRKLKRVSLDVPEIQNIQVSEIVEDKARRAHKQIRGPLIVEDTGFYIKSLNHFPGALIKWLIKAIGYEGLCRLIDSYKDRSAYTETAVCFHDGKKLHTFTGRVEGAIPENPRGDKGFEWDTVFQPKGHDKTFAEMSAEEKNKISHRSLAFEKFKDYLESLKL